MAVAPQNIMAQLRGMPDAQLAKYAAMHKNDPFIFPLAFQESQTRKQTRSAQQAQMAGQEQPKVVDQAVSQMAAVDPMGNVTGYLPEDMGIGRLPAKNLTKMAGGGIVAFEEGGEVPSFARGGINDEIFNDAFLRTLKYEGGRTNDTGGDTKYGISKKGNPDVDIDALTVEGARNIYKKRYWDAISGDKLAALDPTLAKVAFDTAVNQGVSKAKQYVTESGGDPAKLIQLRGEHYAGLVEKNPNKYGAYAKGWMNRLGNLATDLAIPSARADELPQQQTQATEEKGNARGVGAAVGLGTLAGTMGAGMGIPVAESTKAIYPSGTTARQALTQLGRAASVPAAVGIGGLQASGVARNNLELMSPEQRQQMAANPMLSAMSGDTGLAGAIMNAGQAEKDQSSKMPYLEQMGNVGKFLVGHPDSRKGAAKEEAKKEAAKPYDFTQFDKATDAYMAERDAKKAVTDIAAKPKVEAPLPPAAAAVDSKTDASSSGIGNLFKDPRFLMGMRLLGTKNKNFLGGVGEAGTGTVADMAALRKMDLEEKKGITEDKYRTAYANYLDESAGAIARGAKEKNETQLAEKTAQEYYDTWSKNNKMALMTNPALGEQVRQQLRKEAYDAFKLPFPGATVAGAPKADPLGILSKG